MNEGKIAVRYSKALFITSREKNKVDEVREDMLFILDLVAMDEVRELIDSPVIANNYKKKAILSLTEGRVSDITKNLIDLVINNNRESYLPGIARSYISKADVFNGITRATLTTAMPAGPDVTGAVKKIISDSLNTKVELTEVVNPDITGGFLLRVEDTFIDGSVRTQLRKIKKELKEQV